MSRLTTLLFDVDGTLADTEEIHRQSFNKAFRQADLDWEWSQALYGELLAVTGGKERIKHYLATHRANFVPPLNLDEYVAGLHAAKTDIYTRSMAAGELPLRPGVLRLLEAAREAGLRLGIATTTTPANVTALLQHSISTDALGWFDVIAAGSVVPAKKPAPDIYRFAMQAMDVSADECLAFEDSENGLRSARGAGLETLITVNEYTKDHDFIDAAMVVDTLGEPDAPMQVLAGMTCDQPCIDIDCLYRLHAAARSGEG
ncbi:Xylulose-1,5-bisphosphate phosphatase CbbY, converts this Rubisco inhibiting byproduct to xylulose-5P [hydrothermal vent metagenome]|uniref:Xylulose-1,5-bisphosphate phosphatase CbbY, converts this Rubisco inhibiting byproduct to xylulose-5P n=1 Tax=hydrothermal vent metagenome TaxID=652676 RepID=A0A3B0YQD9_9ZZZZ